MKGKRGLTGILATAEAVTRRRVPTGIGARLRHLGVLVMGGVVFASVPVNAGTDIVVPRDFPTIQAAVDAAAPGARIKVRKGTYKEEVVIAKNLTLEGSGAGAAIIKAPSTLTPFGTHVPSGKPLVAVVRITDGAHVRLSGFTVTGPIPCGVQGNGIRVVKAATLDLSHSHVTRIRPEGATCLPQNALGRGVGFGLPPFFDIDGESGTTGHGTVTHVAVDAYRQAGITVAGPGSGSPSTATISHAVITGGAQIPINGQYGIDITIGAVAQVEENTVRGNVCTGALCGPDPINDFQSVGIFVNDAQGGSEISKNRVADNDVGIYQVASPNCCTISRNELTNNGFFGIVIQDGDGTTSGNKIKGGQVGIAVVADAVDTVGVLRGDKIKRASVAPVQEIDCCGFTATAIVEDN